MNVRKPILSEEKLIEAMISNSSIGAEALYNMYSKSLYGVILGIVINKEMAEDILQETFIKIWNRKKQYEPEKGRLFTWMVTIARNSSKDMLRSKTHRKFVKTIAIEERIHLIEQENQIIINTDIIGVRSFLHSLKKEHLVIFELIYYKGYTHKEIAELLGIPLGTVKTRWRQGILALRAIYGDNIKSFVKTEMVE